MYKKSGQLRVGTSGWQYEHWGNCFYPEWLAAGKQFEFYQSVFNTVEVNATFYHLLKESTFLKWKERSDATFVFSLKAWRRVTHLKKLIHCEQELDLFLNRARLLGKKLGIILYQLPPQMKKDIGRLETFLKLLPSDINHAIEFRHDSWNDDAVLSLLKAYRVSYCIISAPNLACCIKTTSKIAYIRLHGISNWYNYNYSEDDIRWWVLQLQTHLADNDVFLFFNNDAFGYAPKNAILLKDFYDL